MTSKPLIVYYSKTGTTARIAEIVQRTIRAEIKRLGEPEGWRGRIRRYSLKDKDVKEFGTSVGEYDPIILLTPVWKGRPTSSMVEFLERIELKGKKVVFGLVGANKTNPNALEKLRRKAIEKGSIFIETIFLKGVLPGRDWTDLKEEDYLREAARLVEKVSAINEFVR